MSAESATTRARHHPSGADAPMRQTPSDNSEKIAAPASGSESVRSEGGRPTWVYRRRRYRILLLAVEAAFARSHVATGGRVLMSRRPTDSDSATTRSSGGCCRANWWVMRR